MNICKKILVIAALAVVPMLAATPAKAAPLFSGTSTFNVDQTLLAATELVTVDWAVYAPGAANSFAATTTDYLYAYTLTNTNGLASGFSGDYVLAVPGLTGMTSSGVVNGTNMAVTTPFAGDLYANFHITNFAGAGTSSAPGTGTAWFTSAIAPTAGNFIVNGNPNIGQMAAPVPGGGALTGGVPGVPEPQTWALLLAMMGFTMVWMRRKQDDDAPLETTIAA